MKLFKFNIVFITSFIIFLIFSIIVLSSFSTINKESAESARYFFSTIAQSQAAIIAIVITLTLVAVQLAAQTYTPRIMNLFLKSKAFWALLTLYGISIIYDVAVLAIIPPISSTEILNYTVIFGNKITFNSLILVGFILIVGTLSFLFFFIQHIIKQLEPEKIVESLAKTIDLNSIKMAAEGDMVEDPLLPIKEIGRKSLISGDETTAIKVIAVVTTNAEKIIEKRDFAKNTPFEIDENVISYFTTFLSDLANRSLECRSIVVFNNITESLNKIGVLLSDKKAIDTINILAELKEMEKSIQIMGLEKDTWNTLYHFKVVSLEAAKNRQWDAIEYSIGILGLFVSEYREKKIEYSDEDKIYGGFIVGFRRHFVIINSIKEISMAIIEAIPNINGKESIDHNEDYFKGIIELESSISHLKSMAFISIENGWDHVLKNTIDAIVEISCALIKNGGENLYRPINPVKLMSESLKEIATYSTSDGTLHEINNIIISLKEVAEYISNKSSMNVYIIIVYLEDIYKFINLNYCKDFKNDIIEGASNSFREIGRLTMNNDNNFLTDEEIKKSEYEISKPPTQKIVEIIEEIAINACNKSWEDMAKDAVRNIIFFGTAYIRNENEDIGKMIIVNLKNIDEKCKEKYSNLISEILSENEERKTFGLNEWLPDEEWKSKGIDIQRIHDIEMDDNDFKAFLRFKEFYELAD